MPCAIRRSSRPAAGRRERGRTRRSWTRKTDSDSGGGGGVTGKEGEKGPQRGRWEGGGEGRDGERGGSRVRMTRIVDTDVWMTLAGGWTRMGSSI
jgi:hypothetical protein